MHLALWPHAVQLVSPVGKDTARDNKQSPVVTSAMNGRTMIHITYAMCVSGRISRDWCAS